MGLEQRFFEVDGILIADGASIYSGSINPSSFDLPIGSIYLRTNGELWKRNGLGIWELVTGTNTVATQEELIDYNSLGEPELMFDDDGETYMREEL
ncbi:MAG: hypothetical protein WC679_00055 [Bacteroidales bacterium]|jgi:hypothetical protein